jgi:nucleotide-binding universal stress UspA family protein
MFKRIIVAIDGSEHSYQTLDYARNLAECFGSTLWLVHAFPRTSDLLGYDDYEKLVARRVSAGQHILNEARHRLGETSFAVHEELIEEPAAEAILTVAETHQADLIVMGTRGLSSLQGLLLGSVSSKVMHHAACPILLVR